jgi:hypothetical protein
MNLHLLVLKADRYFGERQLWKNMKNAVLSVERKGMPESNSGMHSEDWPFVQKILDLTEWPQQRSKSENDHGCVKPAATCATL